MRFTRFATPIAALISLLGLAPGVHAAAIWVSLAAGVPGSPQPSTTHEFQVDSANQQITLTQASGTGTLHAVTGGGETWFGSIGVPVLLNTSDGIAYVASSNAPVGPFGQGSLSSLPPVAGGAVPSNATLLGVSFADDRLSVTLSNPNGSLLGSGTLATPAEGWWVIGLGPALEAPPPESTDGPSVPSDGSTPPSPPSVPEPAGLLLVLSASVPLLGRFLAKGSRAG